MTRVKILEILCEGTPVNRHKTSDFEREHLYSLAPHLRDKRNSNSLAITRPQLFHCRIN
jgi:hypothetical protein